MWMKVRDERILEHFRLCHYQRANLMFLETQNFQCSYIPRIYSTPKSLMLLWFCKTKWWRCFIAFLMSSNPKKITAMQGSYKGNTVRAKNGLTLTHSPPTPFSQLPRYWTAVEKYLSTKLLLSFPGSTLCPGPSRSVELPSEQTEAKAESSQDQWNPSSCGRWTLFPTTTNSTEKGGLDGQGLHRPYSKILLKQLKSSVSFLLAPYQTSLHIEDRVKST